MFCRILSFPLDESTYSPGPADKWTCPDVSCIVTTTERFVFSNCSDQVYSLSLFVQFAPGSVIQIAIGCNYDFYGTIWYIELCFMVVQ